MDKISGLNRRRARSRLAAGVQAEAPRGAAPPVRVATAETRDVP